MLPFCGSLVLVRGRCCRALRRAPNLLPVSLPIGEGLVGFIVEASAALSILIYLAILWFSGRWSQKLSGVGFNYSLLTGNCVGAGKIAFSTRWTALSCAGYFGGWRGNHGHRWHLVSFRETPSWQGLLGIAFAILFFFAPMNCGYEREVAVLVIGLNLLRPFRCSDNSDAVRAICVRSSRGSRWAS